MLTLVRYVVALGVLFVSTPVFAADYFVCERDDGTVHISDRSYKLPDDCGARRTESLQPVARSTDVEDSDRWAEMDRLIADARARRAAEAQARDDWYRQLRVASRQLVERRMALEETQNRLASERWRWSAFMPGQWIILFADERRVASLEKREALLHADVAESIATIRVLLRQAHDVGVRAAEAEALTPDLSDPAPAPKMDIEGWGY